MDSLKLDASSTALVLIDLQRGIVGLTTSPYSASAVVEKGASLAAAFRDSYATVIYVRVDLADMIYSLVDLPHGDQKNPPPPSASELVPESGVKPDDVVITKRHWSAFGGTDLEVKLRTAGVVTLVVAGISTNIGVESTVRGAASLGFSVVVVEDACTSVNAEAHRFAFEHIFPRLGRVRNTAEVINALG
jgi:nicotinamidase-related amidase